MKKKLLLFLLIFATIVPAFSGLSFTVSAANDEAYNTYDNVLTSLTGAISGAYAGETIKLNRDITISSTVTVNKQITIDGNGHTVTYTGTESAFNITKIVTFKNITINSANGGGFKISDGGNLTLGVENDDTSTVTVKAKGSGDADAPIRFAAANTVLNSYNADMSGLYRIFAMCGQSGITCNIYGGKYTMTCTRYSSNTAGYNGGRLMQANGANGKINFYGGNFFADWGYIFNYTGSGITVNINGGYFYYSGNVYNLMIMKSKSTMNINGGVFHTPNLSKPFSLADDGNNAGMPTMTVYGGTFAGASESPIGVAAGATLNLYNNRGGITYINSDSGAEVDIFKYKPTIKTGAAVSLDPDNMGIRFTAVMRKQCIEGINAIKDSSGTVEYGMFIAPKENFDEYPGFNLDVITAAALKKGYDYVDIPAGNVTPDANGDIIFTGELTGLSEKYYATDFAATAYVKYVIGERTVYAFSNFNDGCVRNMKDIAKRALADHDEQGDTLFTDAQIAVLEEYANATYVSNRNTTVKVLSLNILTHNADYKLKDDGSLQYKLYGNQTATDYNFASRLKYVQALVEYTDPDVMLFQEFSGQDYWGTAITLNGSNGRYTSPQFPGYEWVNHGNRRGVLWENNTKSYMGSNDAFHAHNFVIYDTSKFEYVASGTKFATKTGDRSQDGKNYLDNNDTGTSHGGSDDFGAYSFNDIGDYTYVVLRDKVTGIVSIYASTHTYNGSIERYALMLDNLQCLTDGLAAISAQYDNAPVTVGGDFNMYTGGTIFDNHYDHMVNVANYTDAKTTGSDSGTARSYGNNLGASGGSSANGPRIDYIFSNGAEPYAYEALNGQVNKTTLKYEPNPKWNMADLANPVFDGSACDISDHLPIMTTLVIGKTSEYKYKAQTKDNYTNPNTANDEKSNPSGAGADTTNIVFTNSTTNASILGNTVKGTNGAQYFDASVVADATYGSVLKIMATDETNHVNFAINHKAFGGTNVSTANKITIVYKTEMSYNTMGRAPASIHGDGVKGPDIHFGYSMGSTALSGGVVKDIETATNGEWKTLTVNISSSGELNQIGFYGRSDTTGLMAGDAIYIASITIS